MSMITEFVERLREQGNFLTIEQGAFEVGDMLNDAADVIEELSAKLQAANMERSSQYYNGGWIPVSEPPKHTDDYLVVVGINYEGEGMYDYVRTANYNTVFKAWCVYETNKAIVGEVKKWMLLPPAYKESEE